jgi:anti-sigma regulatory factor (Ser/Thr protein kinase)
VPAAHAAVHRVGCTTVEDSLSQGVRSIPGRQPGGQVAPVLGSLDRQLIDRLFGREEITLVRHEVTGSLTAAGLCGDRLHGYVLAVNEVVTNVVLHAGGQGRLTLRLAGDSAWCTITDSGPGIPARYLSRPEVPGAFEVGGRGIWLAYQLCDEVTMATGPIGTTIGLRIALPGPPMR